MPAGSILREGDTGRVHRGGFWIQVEAQLNRILYFYRE
jgi:hypothetical protein